MFTERIASKRSVFLAQLILVTLASTHTNDVDLPESNSNLSIPNKSRCPSIQLYIEHSEVLTNSSVSAENRSPRGQVQDYRVNCSAICCYQVENCFVLRHKETCYEATCINVKNCNAHEPLNGTSSKLPKLSVRNFSAFDQVPENSSAKPILVVKACEVAVNNCPLYEECVQINSKSRNGVCQCEFGDRMANGSCPSNVPTPTSIPTTLMPVPDFPATPPCVLTVQVVPKEIQLPEDSTSISAFVIPSPTEGHPYTYRWTPVQLAKEKVGTMTNTDTPTLKLTELAEGTYVFRVNVTSDTCSGETLANLTVLPAKRLNQPPQPVIRPTQVHVRLPTNIAIFDGSLSTDDTGIASYEWELQQGPIGFQTVLQAGPTLELERLIPGNYTVKLVLTDVDGAKNWTTANLTVVSRTDYPPEANAGPDAIVYLPQNSIALNGSLSADDRGIASYEWTRLAGVQGGAVDMENTHTPLLQLSLLQEGMYTFQLKVTDTSGQTDTDVVNVFVREPKNKLPVANAGEDKEIALPTTWVVLNGSLSTDVLTVNKWKWSQLKGPKMAKLVTLSPDSVNATSLTVGNYTFLLEACDEGEACSNDTVNVKVIQRENEKPKANAGGEQSVTLPVTLAILNGSQSTDDLGIVSWYWSREPHSLAAGKILGNTSYTPTLMLTDLVPGHYYFRLRVTDMQGASDEDVASLLVHPDPRKLDMVLLIMNSDIHMFKEHERIKLGEQLGLLLHNEGPIAVHMDKIAPDSKSDHVSIIFYASYETSTGLVKIIPGREVALSIKGRLYNDPNLLLYPVESIDTLVCQNNCSGHGTCDETTRVCLCDSFWMENYISVIYGGERNCEWSTLYVVIIVGLLLTAFGALVWLLVNLCRRGKSVLGFLRLPRRKRRSQARYTSVNDPEFPTTSITGSLLASESESDQEGDVVFQMSRRHLNRSKTPSGRLANGNNNIEVTADVIENESSGTL